MEKDYMKNFEYCGPKSQEIIKMILEYEVPTMWALSEPIKMVVWDSAQGCIVKDADGKEYLDFISAFATAITGHSNPKVREKVFKQAEKLIHAPDSPTLPRALLAKKLAEITPPHLKKTVFGLNGGDAVDIALRLVQSYTKKSDIIAFHGGFHGRGGIGSASVTSTNIAKFGRKAYYVPYAYCYRCAFDKTYPECDLWCTKYIESILEGHMTGLWEPAALIVEPVQGAGGYVVPPDTYLPTLEKICRNHDLLFIVDEIQTAFGRYGGTMTASESLGIKPDFITLGKGLTGGYPLSAVITTEEIANCWRPTIHMATYTGNPLMCAAALAEIEVVEELKLPERVKRMEPYFKKCLEDKLLRLKSVGDISVKGLFAGLEFVEDKNTKKPASLDFMNELGKNLLKNGLIVHNGEGIFLNRVGLAPPLIIDEEKIDKGTTILEKSIKETERKIL
jgi:4-aminobutyrate aminotransferase-like enzyme